MTCHPLLRAALAAVLLAASPMAALAQEAGTIGVRGEGSVEVVPDEATLSLGVEVRAETSAEALATATEAMEESLALLAGFEIPEGDIQTGQFRLTPIYRTARISGAERTEIEAFQVNNSIEVTVADLGLLGQIITDVSASGTNRISGLRFGLQDPSAAEDAARRAAMADARARATLYAEEAEVQLGSVLAIREDGVSGYQEIQQDAGLARTASLESYGAPVPVAPGEIAIFATVQVTYAFTTPLQD